MTEAAREAIRARIAARAKERRDVKSRDHFELAREARLQKRRALKRLIEAERKRRVAAWAPLVRAFRQLLRIVVRRQREEERQSGHTARSKLSDHIVISEADAYLMNRGEPPARLLTCPAADEICLSEASRRRWAGLSCAACPTFAAHRESDRHWREQLLLEIAASRISR